MSSQQNIFKSLSTNINYLSRKLHDETKLSTKDTFHSKSNSKSRSVILNNDTSTLTNSNSKKRISQSKLHFPVLVPSQVKNPYQKPPSIQRTISIQTKLQSPMVTDDMWIGNKIQPLIQSHARIWVQNINGIDISNNFAIFQEQLNHIKRYDIHFLSLTEARLNPYNPYISDNIDAAFHFTYPEASHILSNTKIDTSSTFQYGGVLSSTMNSLSSQVAGMGQDTFGRFNW